LALAESDEPVIPGSKNRRQQEDRIDVIVAQLQSKGVGIMRAVGDEALALNSFSERRGRALNITVVTRC